VLLHEYLHMTEKASESEAWDGQIKFYQTLLNMLNPNDPRFAEVKEQIENANHDHTGY